MIGDRNAEEPARSREPRAEASCNHRGQAREFVRDAGKVRMICRGCGKDLSAPSNHEAA